MFTRFEPTKSTKGASKMRRDLINAEIANLRDLLPLPPSTRQRLSQLQLMALICVYVRKANYFQQVLKCHDFTHHYHHHAPTPNIGFSKAMNGFLMMMTQHGKLLYISDNAAEYLGHSMEDLLIHGDSVYDIIDKQDHQAVQAELCRSTSPTASPKESRMFLCRINVARNARRQMRFGDQKVVLVRGHFLSFLPLCSRNEPVFLAACSPLAMPETRECVVQGATNVFTTVHSMDMKIKHIDKNGEWYLGWDKNEIRGISWYQLLHWECTKEAQAKHKLITQSEQERSCILLLRMQKHNGDWLWVHAVLQVKDNMENNQQPVIVCTNQVLSDSEAVVMAANLWLYHYYSVQSKLQYGLAYEAQMQSYYQHYQESPYSQNGDDQQPHQQQQHLQPQQQHLLNDHHQPQQEPLHHHHHPHPHHHHLHHHHSGGHLMAALGADQHPSPHPNHLHHLQHHHHGGGSGGGGGFEPSPNGPVDYSRHSSLGEYAGDERYSIVAAAVEHHHHRELGRKRRRSAQSPQDPHDNDADDDASRPRKVAPHQHHHHVVVETAGGGTLLALAHRSPSVEAAPVKLHHQHPHHHQGEDPDFMDRWNPSPPWSDTTPPQRTAKMQPLQPVDQLQQQQQPQHFTFDWLPDHYAQQQQQQQTESIVRQPLHVIGHDDNNNTSNSSSGGSSSGRNPSPDRTAAAAAEEPS